MVVVLPAPFGPRKPVTLPGSMPNERSLTATLSPYRFVRPRTSIMGDCPLCLETTPVWPARGMYGVGPSDDSALLPRGDTGGPRGVVQAHRVPVTSAEHPVPAVAAVHPDAAGPQRAARLGHFPGEQRGVPAV